MDYKIAAKELYKALVDLVGVDEEPFESAGVRDILVIGSEFNQAVELVKKYRELWET